MTVYHIGKNKIKITLSDGEVRSYFGEYENISTMSGNAKLIIGMLLQGSLAELGFNNEEKLLVEIKAKENSGCIIMISPALSKNAAPRYKTSVLMFEFSETENLIRGIVRLSRLPGVRRAESSLYRMYNTYRLLLNTGSARDFFFMNEYCIRQSDSPIEAAYTEEYGTLVAGKNAIERIVSAFF